MAVSQVIHIFNDCLLSIDDPFAKSTGPGIAFNLFTFENFSEELRSYCIINTH